MLRAKCWTQSQVAFSIFIIRVLDQLKHTCSCCYQVCDSVNNGNETFKFVKNSDRKIITSIFYM